MPMITFTEAGLLRGKIVEPAWYRVRIDSIGEAPASKGDSTNYPAEGTILYNADNGNKDFAGVPIQWNFNSKFEGGMAGFLAAFGVSAKAGARFDLGATVGKEVDIFVENRMTPPEFGGRMQNQVNHKYRPVRS